MNDEANPTNASAPAQAPKSPRDRLRLEEIAVRKLSRQVPRSNKLTPEQVAALHEALDEYTLVWRKVRLAAGLPVDEVFPPSDDPAEALLPVWKRTPRGAP